MRQIVRRTHTQLGEFMLPALATLAAPYAVAEWEFIETPQPSDKQPSDKLAYGSQCVGCGEVFWVYEFTGALACSDCHRKLASGTWESDEPAPEARS